MKNFRAGLWITDLSSPVSNMTDWLNLVQSKAQEAKDAGASLMVMPEYACIHWLGFAPDMPGTEYLPWMDAQRDATIDALCGIAKNVGITIIPGSFPVLTTDKDAQLCRQPNDLRADTSAVRYYNRAYILGADGSIVTTQDKLVLTPWELDEKSWNIQQGVSVNTFDVDGVKCAVLICLDVEQPALANHLFEKNVDVLIVPSMTMHPSGYNRIFVCARARAVEGVMGVLAVGAVGEPPCLVGKETNYSGAGAFGPCEMDIAPDGLFHHVDASYGMAMAPGHLAIVDVPVEKIRHKKAGQPEAWPGIVTL